jgi:hypothetical protein
MKKNVALFTFSLSISSADRNSCHKMLNQREGWAAASCAHIATLADRRRDRAVGATIPYDIGGTLASIPHGRIGRASSGCHRRRAARTNYQSLFIQPLTLIHWIVLRIEAFMVIRGEKNEQENDL